jgi:pimeloyl-ACP methyl ester carboxylesterase
MLIPIVKKFIRSLPSPIAFELTKFLASRTSRPRVAEEEKKAMQKASRIHYGKNKQLVGWSWGKGPLVVLIHGWNGRSAQMAPLAEAISMQGYRCVAIEIEGHGESPGKEARWEYFMKNLDDFRNSQSEPVYAYIGHSAGALALMAARDRYGIRADRFVCICAPSFPHPPIRTIRAKLNPPEAVIDRYKEFLANEFAVPWERLESGSAFLNAHTELLLVYDENDRYVNVSDGEKIHSICSGSHLLKTKEYGHMKILRSPELERGVLDFLRP